MLFGRWVGFSGNPSDSFSDELGRCNYGQCIDGQILHYPTIGSIVTSRMLPAQWSV